MNLLYVLMLPVVAIAVILLFAFTILIVDVILWALRGFQDFGF